MSGFTGEGATASMGSILTSPSFLGRRPRRPDRNQGHHSYSQRSHGIIHRIRGCTDTGTFTSPYAKINKQIFGKECDTWWSDHRNNESWMLLKLLKARFPCAQYCANTSTALHSCNFLPVPAPPLHPPPPCTSFQQHVDKTKQQASHHTVVWQFQNNDSLFFPHENNIVLREYGPETSESHTRWKATAMLL